jgi:hypothetical protein
MTMLTPIIRGLQILVALILSVTPSSYGEELVVTVVASANSYLGGAPVSTISLTGGQAFTVKVSPDDLWNSGPLPRWSNANGQSSELIATGADESGESAGILIGIDGGLWTQDGFSAPIGALVGRIGNTYLLLGISYSGTAPAGGGTLELFYWDVNPFDNTGEISVTINTSLSLVIPPSEGGVVNGGGLYTAGSVAMISATPHPGFMFTGWAGDASGFENPLQVVMNQPKTVKAEFSQDTTDIDKDGLSGYEEAVVFGTDPDVADTDKDGISDGEEAGLGIFSLVDGVFAWEQARVDALVKGGRLAAFDSSREWQGALRAIGPDALAGRLGLWIGASDHLEEGTWRWVTGEPFTFTNWAQGEPDNGNDSDFAEVAGTESGVIGKWYDRRATALRDGYILEKGYASSPLKADSDDDGLSDAEEKAAGTHPLLADTDGDGLSDRQEIHLSQTSPLRVDTDDNGREDSIEDPDGDGLTNAQEILEFSTNPLVADTDGDGFNDAFELSSGFDPGRELPHRRLE